MTKQKPFFIKHKPATGDYGIYDSETGQLLRSGDTMHDVTNIMANMEANLPADQVGFGDWGVPGFFLQKTG